jgi:hypothetical protein
MNTWVREAPLKRAIRRVPARDAPLERPDMAASPTTGYGVPVSSADLSSPPRAAFSRGPEVALLHHGTPEHTRLEIASSAILAMVPLADGESARAPEPSRRGVRWFLRGQDEIALAIRTRDFATEDRARRDAQELVARAHSLRPVMVTDGRRRHGWWLVLDDQPVLVSAFPVSPSRMPLQSRFVIQALAHPALA